MMIPYATSTGTKRNVEDMRDAEWRLLLTPDRRNQNHWGMPYALDNGAWAAYCQSKEFNADAFRELLTKYAAGADWVVVPDIVAGGLDSLHFSFEWLDELGEYGVLKLLAVQDGMKPKHIEPFIGKQVGIFVGGTTEWKLDSLPDWGALARESGVYLHVGRVNSVRRIRYCSGFGVHSFDGTSVTRYAETLPKLDFARRQASLDFDRVDGKESTYLFP